MAAPVAAFVQLPTDSGNTGKKIQTQSEVIGADTVHAHFFVPRSRRKVLGAYYFANAVLSVQATAQNGTTTGHWWLEMPTGAVVRGRLKKLCISYSLAVETECLTAPRTNLHRFTFTGTASGATVTPSKRRSDDTANVANIRTASTGMTVTLVAAALAYIIPAFPLLTSGYTMYGGWLGEWNPDNEDDYLDFDAGEGFVFYQPDAGTASDPRRLGVWGSWDEYDDA